HCQPCVRIKSRKTRINGLLALFAALFFLSASHEPGGTLEGKVTNVRDNYVYEGILIKVEGYRPRVTDQEGNLRFSNVAPGTYSVHVASFDGDSIIQGVLVEEGKKTYLDVHLLED